MVHIEFDYLIGETSPERSVGRQDLKDFSSRGIANQFGTSVHESEGF